jgi:hypothetical protein
MEGDVYMTKVNLRTHMPDEKERRGQSRETAIEASTRTNFFFTNDRTFLIGSKRTVCCFDDVAVGRRADVPKVDILLSRATYILYVWARQNH